MVNSCLKLCISCCKSVGTTDALSYSSYLLLIAACFSVSFTIKSFTLSVLSIKLNFSNDCKLFCIGSLLMPDFGLFCSGKLAVFCGWIFPPPPIAV